MIVAIDDTGGFALNDESLSFWVAVQLRQRKSLHREHMRAFAAWERSIPRSQRNHRGEVKGSALHDAQLEAFVTRVVRGNPRVIVTAVGVRPKDNPQGVLEKHRHVAWVGICEGQKRYAADGHKSHANTYFEFSHWFKNLSYAQYLKMKVMGECVGYSVINAYGHSITGGYDYELPRLKLVIDRDLVTNPRADIFWHEYFRNQFFHSTKRNPIPVLNTWERAGHPVLDKFHGSRGMNELFWKQTSFDVSHETPELRIADVVATIVGRHFNRRGAARAYKLLHPCIARRHETVIVRYDDLDLTKWRYDPTDNPFDLDPEERRRTFTV